MAQNTLTMNELVKTYLNLQESIQHQFVMADNKVESGEKREALKLFNCLRYFHLSNDQLAFFAKEAYNNAVVK